MPPETDTAVETPATETPAEGDVQVEQDSQDTQFQIEVNGQQLTLLETKRKGKGDHAGENVCYVVVDVTQPDPFAAIRAAVGEENWNRYIVRKVIRPASVDASEEALKDGEIKDTDYGAALCDIFAREQSANSTTALKDKQTKLLLELKPFIEKQANNVPLSQDEKTNLVQVLANYTEVSKKLEEKIRKGKEKAAATKAKKVKKVEGVVHSTTEATAAAMPVPSNTGVKAGIPPQFQRQAGAPPTAPKTFVPPVKK